MQWGANKLLVARKEHYIYEEHVREPNKKKVLKTKTRRVINKNMYFAIIAMFFISSLFILSGYANITEIKYDINESQNIIRELELERIDLETKLVASKNSSNISERAQNNLGMIYPGEDQIVYIAVDNINQNTPDDISLAQRIKDIFSIFSSIY